MRMDDPYSTFTYLVERIAELFPNLAFVHLVEPRAAGGSSRVPLEGEVSVVIARSTYTLFMAIIFQSNDFIRKIWLPRPLVTAGGYTRDTAIATCEETGELIGVGRYWISNVSVYFALFHVVPDLIVTTS